MIREELIETIRSQIRHANQTSYKFYFFLAILILCRDNQTILLNSLAEMMMALSWNDITNHPNAYTQNDMLPRLKQDAMSVLPLFEYEETKYVYETISSCGNHSLLSNIHKLTCYAPYSFLDRREWRERWKGMYYFEKLKQIEELALTDEEMMYTFEDGAIKLRDEFFYYFQADNEEFVQMAKEELDNYYSRREK